MSEGLTQALAQFALGPPLPTALRREAARAFVNFTACALGGAGEPACAHAFALADEFSGSRHATVIGRSERLDAPHAALQNSLQSSIQTFDDTHLPSVVHPTGPVAAAALALLEHRRTVQVGGAQFLDAIGHGIEVACRVGLALTAPPSRIALGAFTTGLVGGLGAAAACGRLLGLDAQRLRWALGIAAAQAGGLRATHATMAGGWVPAAGARIGLTAVLLAERGFDGGQRAIEGPHGLLEVFALGAQAAEALQGLGEDFELARLSYKPYPCGVVIHPVIDACLEVAPDLHGAAIERVQLEVHPLALRLANTRHPASALACNTSLHHWAAATLLRARAGLAEACDEALHDPDIGALRERVEVSASDVLRPAQAGIAVHLRHGPVLRAQVVAARGSVQRPLTDIELAAKFSALAEPRLGAARSDELLALCQQMPERGPAWLEAYTQCAVPA